MDFNNADIEITSLFCRVRIEYRLVVVDKI